MGQFLLGTSENLQERFVLNVYQILLPAAASAEACVTFLAFRVAKRKHYFAWFVANCATVSKPENNTICLHTRTV